MEGGEGSSEGDHFELDSDDSEEEEGEEEEDDDSSMSGGIEGHSDEEEGEEEGGSGDQEEEEEEDSDAAGGDQAEVEESQGMEEAQTGDDTEDSEEEEEEEKEAEAPAAVLQSEDLTRDMLKGKKLKLQSSADGFFRLDPFAPTKKGKKGRTPGGSVELPAGAEKVVQREPMTFVELNLSRPLLRAIRKMGYEAPTPIQVKHNRVSTL